MPFIQESENKQEDYGLEFIKIVRSKEYGICVSRGNPKSLSLKLYWIKILCDDPDYM